MDEVFRALADPHRRALLDRLFRQDGQTLNQLCTGMDISRQAISKHLAVLEAAKLVAVRWRGREKHHFLNPVPIREIHRRWVHRYADPKLDALHALKRRVEKEQDND